VYILSGEVKEFSSAGALGSAVAASDYVALVTGFLAVALECAAAELAAFVCIGAESAAWASAAAEEAQTRSSRPPTSSSRPQDVDVRLRTHSRAWRASHSATNTTRYGLSLC
jgi:hypothetical protein